MAKGYKTGGREAGTPNLVTADIKQHFEKLLEGNLEALQQDIESLEPKDRVKALLAIARFVIPTVKAIEIEQNKSNFKPFQVNITKDLPNGNN